jgi:hypothetical protein
VPAEIPKSPGYLLHEFALKGKLIGDCMGNVFVPAELS